MPSKNRRKQYTAESFYHVYNRGVERRLIFVDAQDYEYMLSLLDQYLTAATDLVNEPFNKYKRKNYSQDIELAAYCLMPNHFHFLLKQHSERGMSEFMHSLMTSYVMYFNLRHGKRVGNLFQEEYKAVYIKDDEQLIHVSRYIHLNPKDFRMGYLDYPYSSYACYLSRKSLSWLHPQLVLEQFAAYSYSDFVQGAAEKARPFPEKGLAFSALAEAFREMLE